MKKPARAARRFFCLFIFPQARAAGLFSRGCSKERRLFRRSADAQMTLSPPELAKGRAVSPHPYISERNEALRRVSRKASRWSARGRPKEEHNIWVGTNIPRTCSSGDPIRFSGVRPSIYAAGSHLRDRDIRIRAPGAGYAGSSAQIRAPASRRHLHTERNAFFLTSTRVFSSAESPHLLRAQVQCRARSAVHTN